MLLWALGVEVAAAMKIQSVLARGKVGSGEAEGDPAADSSSEVEAVARGECSPEQQGNLPAASLPPAVPGRWPPCFAQGFLCRSS